MASSVADAEVVAKKKGRHSSYMYLNFNKAVRKFMCQKL